MTVRAILSCLGVALTAYLAARGLIWTSPETVERGWLLVLALVIYLPVTWLWIFAIGVRDRPKEVPGTPPPRAPGWQVVLALATTVVVSNITFLAVTEEGRAQPFVTWVIGAIGALMIVVMTRRRPVAAWTGIALLAVATSLWLGPVQALSLGLVGSIVWVAAAQLVVFALDRAARDAERLSELQQAASAWQASQSGRQRERRLHVQRALQTAGPILSRTIENGGNLRPSDKEAARRAEARLRDELRGNRLLDDDVRSEIDAARCRGVAISLFDEGGLDGLGAEELATVRRELAAIVRASVSDRVIIRTSPDDEIAVTVVGRSRGEDATGDDDHVDLFREIRRPY
ncbi:hypothetical protein QE410_002414 [Microbacterium sp. SORGH_AS 1204]|uniref:hypothetical protein n=1 Tax=Microbacterium sp. SORGH_AS_1204 TaxID=3041785 RepID=UPI00278FC6FD|nr:hypothetical protein [Microbacterium sp. SORGH_AS_1204]MDQ1137615.1 hypothetical protein [Microbacterium sp. SORGH_AS_1204]